MYVIYETVGGISFERAYRSEQSHGTCNGTRVKGIPFDCNRRAFTRRVI